MTKDTIKRVLEQTKGRPCWMIADDFKVVAHVSGQEAAQKLAERLEGIGMKSKVRLIPDGLHGGAYAVSAVPNGPSLASI